METIIKVNQSELNENLLKKISQFIGEKKNVDVTISLTEYDVAYAEELDKSIQEAELGQNLVFFTMEDFLAYRPSHLS